MTDEVPWERRVFAAAKAFAEQCATLKANNPYDVVALDDLINALMTELWDRGFSQSEIKLAFAKAVADMPRYAAGLEKRSDGPH